MKIEGVVISCYKLDAQLTRLCVASIRRWYPSLPIWLLKDRHCGEFDTREVEKYWDVRVYPGRDKNLGWGFGKLEVLTELPERRYLILDSDIVFAGRVVDRLENFGEDLVVAKEDYPPDSIEDHFFSLPGLRGIDPDFEFPGFGFNTGQIVATTGRISRQEFDGLVDWNTRSVRHPEIFKLAEQGLVNYVVARKVRQGRLTLRREPFMVWPGAAALTQHIQVKDFTSEGPHPQLLHWAGLRWGKTLEEMPRSEILLHFENLYYERIPLGGLIRRWRQAQFKVHRTLVAPLKTSAKKVLRGDRRTLTAAAGKGGAGI